MSPKGQESDAAGDTHPFFRKHGGICAWLEHDVRFGSFWYWSYFDPRRNFWKKIRKNLSTQIRTLDVRLSIGQRFENIGVSSKTQILGVKIDFFDRNFFLTEKQLRTEVKAKKIIAITIFLRILLEFEVQKRVQIGHFSKNRENGFFNTTRTIEKCYFETIQIIVEKINTFPMVYNMYGAILHFLT